MGDLWGTRQAAVHLKEVETILDFASLLRHRVKVVLTVRGQTQHLCGKVFASDACLKRSTNPQNPPKHLLPPGFKNLFSMYDGRWTPMTQGKTELLVFYIFWLLPNGMWDLSSPTRGQTHVPCTGSGES